MSATNSRDSISAEAAMEGIGGRGVFAAAWFAPDAGAFIMPPGAPGPGSANLGWTTRAAGTGAVAYVG